MNVDDRLLMSYVDNLLSTKHCAKVERLIARSEEVAARVAALRASDVPYQAAFESFCPIPLPERLARNVETLIESHNEGWRTPCGRKRGGMGWLAVAFFTGVMSSGAAFEMWSGATSTSASIQSSSSSAPAWVQAVVGYQTLYARDTLANVKDDHAATIKLVSAIQREDGMAVRVPDLNDDSLTFKRVQRLSYRNSRLVQIVYLPAHGQPVALCVMAESKPDQAPSAQRVGDMNTVTWRHANLAYVLAAKGSSEELQQLAAKIASGKTRTMYG
jgi:anti-sigma factor RsiW